MRVIRPCWGSIVSPHSIRFANERIEGGPAAIDAIAVHKMRSIWLER